MFIRATGSLFQRALFNWHYHWASYDIYDRLAADEVAYISTFFELYGLEHFFFKFGYFYGNRMSSFTYSHRRKGPLPLHSGRFACGTTSQEQEFAGSAAPVLERLGIFQIRITPSTCMTFLFMGSAGITTKTTLKFI